MGAGGLATYQPGDVDRIDADLRQVYASAGAPEAWQMLRWDVDHGETPAMRAAALAFLDKWLK